MRTVPGDSLRPGTARPNSQIRATLRSRTIGPWEQISDLVPQLTQRSYLCARRSIRREVLFAIRGTGKGAKAQRKHTAKSKIRC